MMQECQPHNQDVWYIKMINENKDYNFFTSLPHDIGSINFLQEQITMQQ
jgi:hypothetical protein